MKILIILLSILITGCKTCWYEPVQKERQRIFKECMQLLPNGPEKTHYNDWAEVVSECENAAYYQSQVKVCSE